MMIFAQTFSGMKICVYWKQLPCNILVMGRNA